MAFVCGAQKYVDDAPFRFGIDSFAFEEIVDLVVAQTEGLFIGFGWGEGLEVCGWGLGNNFFRRTQLRGHLPDLAFVESEQWDDISGTIAILGIETGYVFGRMIGAKHQSTE